MASLCGRTICPLALAPFDALRQFRAPALAGSAILLIWFLLFQIHPVQAAPGPGVTQVTWQPSEIGKEVYTFSNSIVGAQPTMNDFQWGYLLIEAAHSLDDVQHSIMSWFNFSNPRNPVLIAQRNAANNKPHMAGFYRDRLIDGFQGKNFNIWDLDDKFIANTYVGSVDPVWYMCQAPYVFRPRNGYGTGGNLMEVADISSGNGAQLTLFDLGSVLSFAVGSTHAIGNLLIASASQAKGAAVFDISDPASPKLLSQIIAGNPVYTSMVHSNRLYQCETTSGIRVYDFSDPYNIKLAGFVPVPDNPRYVILRDGKGYCCPGSAKLVVFDATTLTIEHTYPIGGVADFAQVIGNMVVTGGHQAAQRCSIIPIQQAPDTNGPMVQFASPAPGAIAQAVTSRIGFTMNDHIDITSVTTNTFIVRPVGGIAIDGTYSTQLGMLNFSPALALAPNTMYEVILPAGGIRDVVGNGLAQAFSMQFTTANSTNSGAADGTAGHWRFNNSNLDDSGNSHTAQLLNGAAYTNFSAEGSASVVLDGTNDYVSVGSILLSNQFTIAMWARVVSGATNIQTLAANSAGGFSSSGLRLFINTYQTADKKILVESGNGSNGLSFSSSANVFGPDQWQQLALLVNRSVGTGQLYYAGSPVASGAVRNDFTANGAFTFGAFNGGGSPLKGGIDDIRIYNRLLTSNEIAGLSSPAAPPSLFGFSVSPSQPLVGQIANFGVSATDPNGDALQYSFTFGDGTPATDFGANSFTQHAYASPGRYTSLVRVTDGSSIVSTSALVRVHYPATSPVAVASREIFYDISRDKVWCVNPDSDTISRINALTLAKELEIPTGTKPRSMALRPDNAVVWVACEKSDEIWVLDAATGSFITKTNLGYGSAPNAVVFSPAGTLAYVAGRGSRMAYKLQTSSLAVLQRASLGFEPSSLALSSDSSRLFVTRFISPDARGEVWEYSPSFMSLTRILPLAFDNTPDGENSGRGVPNYLIGAAISPDGKQAWVPSKKDNIARGTLRDGNPLTHDNSVRSIISQIDLVNNIEALTNRIDVDNHSLPGAACFSPIGDLVYVAYQGNNEVRVFDAYTGNNLSAAGTGFAPQDLCLSPDGSRLYIFNFLSRSISALDVSKLAAGTASVLTPLGETNVVAAEKLATNVLAGKRIFYNAADPRMANEGYLTCISCHLDGDQDGRTWDFTDRGEGLRRTITMLGRRGMGHGRVHWSANFDEIQDFEQDIRNAFGGTGFMSDADFNTGTRNTPLGDPKAGFSPELDAMAAYVASLSDYPRLPNRTNGVASLAAQNGRQHFLNLQCYTCHGGADLTDSAYGSLHDVGTIKTSSGGRLHGLLSGIDTPSLRSFAFAAPFLHDGSASDVPSIFNVTNAPAGSSHALVRSLSPTQQNELFEFLAELDGSEPAVPPAAPFLNSTFMGNSLTLSWPAAASSFGLYSATNLSAPINWTAVTNLPFTNTTVITVNLPLPPDRLFFRLSSP